jgi:multisubunit Na+/H+ antiporter MnhG subunit
MIKKKFDKNTKNFKRRSVGIISILFAIYIFFWLLEANYHLHMLSIVIYGLVFKYIQ